MRTLILIALAVLALQVSPAAAQSTYDRHILSAAVGVPTGSVSVTSTVIRGEVEDLTFGVPPGATGDVSIVAYPEVGPALVLYSNATLAASIRTNFNELGVVLVGDTVTFTVTPVSAHTNVSWKAQIKVAK
jgi:hypothetical protein